MLEPGTKSNISLARDGGVATVIIDRPEKINALTKPMWRELGRVIAALSAEEDLRCIVLTGAGEKAFSPGNDIGEFAAERSDVPRAQAYGEVMHGTLQGFQDCPIPLLAAIRGICVGGGLELAAVCDIRICGASSRFGVPINRLGLVMAHAELAALLSAAGEAAARELLLEGRIWGAEEARQKGLVSRIVPDADVMAEAYATARRIAAGAPLAARWHKKFIRRLRNPAPLTPEEIAEGFACYGSNDFQIGYRAFLDKAEPKFVGS